MRARAITSTNPSGRTLSYHDQAGDRTRVTWPDGVYAAYGYDAENRVTSIKENGTAQLALYAYDDLGRRTTITSASTADQTTYGYDGASRLTSLTHNIASTANDAVPQRGALRANKRASGVCVGFPLA